MGTDFRPSQVKALWPTRESCNVLCLNRVVGLFFVVHSFLPLATESVSNGVWGLGFGVKILSLAAGPPKLGVHACNA